jgi:hypothetical protein
MEDLLLIVVLAEAGPFQCATPRDKPARVAPGMAVVAAETR